MTLEGWEDLNGDGEIDDAGDDQLFEIVKGTNDEYDMRGYHANSYYNSHFGAGDFLFTYLILSTVMGPRGYYYTTPPSRAPEMQRQRTTYRQSSSYARQAQRNSAYHARQSQYAGSRYQQSRGSVSSNRRTYQSTQKASGGFKTSSAISRSKSGTSISSSSRSGGFGGGGAINVRGRRR